MGKAIARHPVKAVIISEIYVLLTPKVINWGSAEEIEDYILVFFFILIPKCGSKIIGSPLNQS